MAKTPRPPEKSRKWVQATLSAVTSPKATYGKFKAWKAARKNKKPVTPQQATTKDTIQTQEGTTKPPAQKPEPRNAKIKRLDRTINRLSNAAAKKPVFAELVRRFDPSREPDEVFRSLFIKTYQSPRTQNPTYTVVWKDIRENIRQIDSTPEPTKAMLLELGNKLLAHFTRILKEELKVEHRMREG